MKKNSIVLIGLVFLMKLSMAQSPSELANSSAVKETQDVSADVVKFPEDALTDKMTTLLLKRGKSLNIINQDGSIYVIASATTTRPSNMSGFVFSRNVAYNIAELTAKMNLLRLAGEQITSGRGFTMLEDIIEGEDPDVSKTASMLQKAGKVIDKSLDKALSYLGVSDKEIGDMNEDEKKVIFTQTYNETVKSLVAGMVKGCATVWVAEGELGGDDYQVSICMKYSPEFQSLASLIKNNTQYQVPVSKVQNSIAKIEGYSAEKMVGKLGAKVTFNSKGEMIVFGFGQQEVKTTGSRASAAYSRAYSKARLRAVNNIKNFVAEDIVAEESITDVEKIREYSDSTKAYYSRQSWEQAVKSKSSTLNLSTFEVRRWKSVHPISKQNMVGVVVAWTLSHKQDADKIKESMDSNPTSPSKTNTTRKQTTKSTIIMSGEEEDL